jgi:hypothetical protein
MPDTAFSRDKREAIEKMRAKVADRVGGEKEDDGAPRNAVGLREDDAGKRSEEAKKLQEKEEQQRQDQMRRANRIPQSLDEQKAQKANGTSRPEDTPPTAAESSQIKYLDPHAKLGRQPPPPSSSAEAPEEIERAVERRKRPNEIGQVPEPLVGSKEMAKPGPMNDINLKPRVPRMHVRVVGDLRVRGLPGERALLTVFWFRRRPPPTSSTRQTRTS